MPTDIRIGTGAIAYKEWKGRFYPKDLPAAKALRFYAERFSALELNTTFYRPPTVSAVETLADGAPADFVFAVKAPRLITHDRHLRNCEAPAKEFFTTIAHFGDRLGPALVQLPPGFKIDLPRLNDFFAWIPTGFRVAVEFRHPSWFVDSVLDFLRAKGAALVFNDADVEGAPFAATADWGYLRLRRLGYADGELAARIQAIEAMNWKQAFVIFKHEETATAPELARRFRALLGASAAQRR